MGASQTRSQAALDTTMTNPSTLVLPVPPRRRHSHAPPPSTSSSLFDDEAPSAAVMGPGEDDSHASDPLLVEQHDAMMDSTSSSPTSTASSFAAPAATATTAAVVVASSSDSSSLSALLSALDLWLKRYVSYTASSLHSDRGLKFLQWTLWLLSRVSLLSKKPRLAAHLRKLYLDLSFARYAGRLLGLPAALEAARSGSWTPPSERHPTMMKWIGRTLAWSMAAYYPLEHVAYVQWMLPSAFPPKKRTAERWSYWSCRAWLVYLVAEAAQCAVQWRELASSPSLQPPGGGDNDEDDPKGADCRKRERQLALRRVKTLLARDLLFLLPCVNWSLPNWDVDPWLPESLVNCLMWLESVVSLTQ